MPTPIAFDFQTGTFGPNLGGRTFVFDDLVFEVDESFSADIIDTGFNVGLASADVDLEVEAGIDLRAGPIVTFEFLPGDVDLDYDLTVDEVVSPEVVGFGLPSLDLSRFSVDGGSLTSSGLDLADSGVFLDLVAEIDPDLGVDFDASAQVFGGTIFDVDTGFDVFPGGSFGGTARVLSLTGSDLDQDFDFAYGSIDLNFPSGIPGSSSTLRADGDGLPNLEASGRSNNVVEAALNIPAVIAQLFGVPPQIFGDSRSFDVGPLDLSVGYSTIVAELGAGLALVQDVAFDPSAVLVELTTDLGQTLTGTLGDVFEFDVPSGSEGTLEVDAAFTLVGDLVTTTGLLVSSFFDLELLGASLSGSVDLPSPIPDPSIKFGLGPLVDERFDLFELPGLDLFDVDQSVSIGPIEASFSIDYEKFAEGTDDGEGLALTTNQRALSALAGDDTVFGNELDNRIEGGDGDDLLKGGGGDDQLIGAAGDDDLQGEAGDDFLDGGADDDRLEGGEGDDFLGGGEGADLLLGGAGDDTLKGGGGDDELDGGEGADNLLGEAGDDLLRGGAGDDTLGGGAGEDELQGGLGDDALTGGEGADLLLGGAGQDRFSGTLSEIDGDTYADIASGEALRVREAALDVEAVSVDAATGVVTIDADGDGSADARFTLGLRAGEGETITVAATLDASATNLTFATASDFDGDGVPDGRDNAPGVANPDQRDTNGDGIANVVDPDLDDDGFVNAADVVLFREVLGRSVPDDDAGLAADADFDGNGAVDVIDQAILAGFYGEDPGAPVPTATDDVM